MFMTEWTIGTGAGFAPVRALREMVRVQAGDAGADAVVRVVIHEEAAGGVESVALAEQGEDRGVGLHEALDR